MAANKPGKAEILAAFFDDGSSMPLYTEGAVSAAYGCANGQSVYAVYENGEPVTVQDIERKIHVLEMAAQTGAPVVTFYNASGAKLDGGLELLKATSALTAQIARVSGVVPQIAVVTGTCAGTSAIHAAAADVCIMAQDAELFLNAPFTAQDSVSGAGSAAFAAKAGVAAVVAADAVQAAKRAAGVVALLPANNLAGPVLFDFEPSGKRLRVRWKRWLIPAAQWNCTAVTASTSLQRWQPSTAVRWALLRRRKRRCVISARPRRPVSSACAMHTASPS